MFGIPYDILYEQSRCWPYIHSKFCVSDLQVGGWVFGLQHFWSPIVTWNSATADKPPTHLCKCNGVADLKIRPSPYMLPCRIWSFCVKGCGHKYTKTSKIGEPWNSAFLEWEAWLSPIHTPLSDTCCLVKLGSYVTKVARINKRQSSYRHSNPIFQDFPQQVQ